MGHGMTIRSQSLVGVACNEYLAQIIIGRSAAIQEIVSLVAQVALHPTTPVLLDGESGVGKEVVARAIHEVSSTAAHLLVPINCAAIPENLLETELFGVEAGAFTDAQVSRDGHLLRANGGTFFLDEVSSMPLILQAKLLRFLETMRFRPVGSTKEHEVKLRVISATNMDLQAAVDHKIFRADLLYRLNVFHIPIPPLRERPEDIEPLVEHFLRSSTVDDPIPFQVSDEAMALLSRYAWPGNVRELRHAIQRGLILCDNHVIRPHDLPPALLASNTGATQRLMELQQQLHLPPEGLDLPTFLHTIEQRFLQEALQYCKHNQVHAASLLGISREQLRYRLPS